MNSWEESACYPQSTFYPLSDGPSIQNHRITMSYFRTPPLHFRRRPPQSNCLPCTVPDPDNGPRLESQTNQGGISRLAPRKLAFTLQSLPPILHRLVQNSMQSYSKGSWGLSV